MLPRGRYSDDGDFRVQSRLADNIFLQTKTSLLIKYSVYFASWLAHRVYFGLSRGPQLFIFPQLRFGKIKAGYLDFDRNKHDVEAKMQNIL